MNRTVGQQLQQAREQLGISIEDAARETHIHLNYLQNLEDDHPELLHSPTQARGFLHLYADFLKLSYTNLLAFWEKAEEGGDNAEPGSETAKRNFPWLKKTEAEPASRESDLMDDSQPEQSPTNVLGDDQIPRAEPPDQEFPEPVIPEDLPASSPDEADLQPEPGEMEIPQTGPSFFQKIPGFFTKIGKKISRLLPLKKPGMIEDEIGGENKWGETSPKVKQSQTSEELFIQIGTALQTRRKTMELSLSDIENFTNLKRSFLIALENGRFEELPSTVQGRGMLNNYAKFLGMQETEVLDLYGQALQLQREEKLSPQRKAAKPAVSVKLNLPEKWRKIINPDLIIGSILIVGLFVFIIWGATQVFSNSGNTQTEAPSISEVLQITPSVSPTPNQTESADNAAVDEATAVPGVAVVENTPTAVATVNAAPLQVYIIAHDRAFLKATVDGTEVFNGRVSPDNVYTYSGNTSINLLTGNASALEVYFNQEYIGTLGEVGEVVNIDFTLNGLITPTPQATQTPTPEIMQGDQGAAEQ
jgi:cytoskeleton protein RodZ